MKKTVSFDKREVILPLMGGLTGPLEIPRLVDTDEIKLLIGQGYEVQEVLKDGTHLKLTTENYNKANNKDEVLEPDPVIPPTPNLITFSSNVVNLDVGESEEVEIKLLPTGSLQELIVRTQDTRIAVVEFNESSGKYKITGVSKGETNIIVDAKYNKLLSGHIKVEVEVPSSSIPSQDPVSPNPSEVPDSEVSGGLDTSVDDNSDAS